MSLSTLTRTSLVALLLFGCASASRTVADVRSLDAESAARLVAEGGLLFEADRSPKNGYQYCSLAGSLIERGDLRLGIREASKALFLGESSGDQCLIANAKRDLSLAYLFAGHLDRAKEYAEAAINGSSSCRDRAIGVSRPAQKVLGDVLLRQGRAKEAIALYEKVRTGNDYWSQVSTISLANAYLAAGDLHKAAELLKQAGVAASSHATLGPMINRGLGQLAMAERRHRDAAVLFEQAAVSASGDDQAYHRLWAFDGLARARLAEGDRAGAVAAYRQALEVAERVRSKFRSEEFRTGFFGEIQQIFDRMVALLVEIGDAERALGVSEQGRARALEDMIRGRVSASAQGQVVAKSSAAIVPVSEIRGALRPEWVVAEYQLTDHGGYAWVIRQSGVRVVAIDVSRDALAAQIKGFRDQIRSRAPGADDAAHTLYRLLVEPLQLREGEHVIVVPHGPLHYLPFQALRGPRGYLIEERPVSYAPSASALATLLGKSVSAHSRVLALGNPDMGNPRMSLPGSEREVRHIKSVFPGAEIYLQKEATKARLVATGPRSDLVHIAAHADVDEVDPLYSAIHLASTDGSSGLLEAHELYSLGFERAPLVSLSACNTGLGRVARGDEILGFTRSFFAAGARTLLVTLWPVEDSATARLMAKFYDRIGPGAADAIREAQLDLLREPTTKHPFFWASFNLIGDPR